MAKIYFHFAAMNAGKTTLLLQASYNYRERGMRTLVLLAAFDDRAAVGKVSSRIGLESDASVFNSSDNLFELVVAETNREKIACVFVDEAQFLSEEQVWQLAKIADDLSIPVMCYGLRTDFQGKLFPGSKALLSIADILREIRTICHCGRKAIMVARLDDEGKPIKEGAQVHIGGNERYTSLCRKHWREAMDVL